MSESSKQSQRRRGWMTFGVIATVLVAAIVIAGVVFWMRTNNEAEQEGQQREREIEEQLSSAAPAPPDQDSSGGDTGDTQTFGDDPLSGASDEEVLGVARDFASVFASDDYSSDKQMRDMMNPLMNKGLQEKFRTVSWFNTPSDTVADATFRSKGTSDALVDVTFERSTPMMRVYVVEENGNWLVSDYGSRG